MSLSKRIENIQRNLYLNVPNLNSGGCIQFAYFFSKKLESLGVPHRVYYMDDYTELTLAERETCAHVVVYIHNIGYIDGYETFKNFKDSHFRYKAVRTDIDKTRKSKRWNTFYNKKKYNSVVKKTIKENFEGYIHPIK